jgi:hypothetical protein
MVYGVMVESLRIDELMTMAIDCAGMTVVMVPATESMTMYISTIGPAAISDLTLIRSLLPSSLKSIDIVVLRPPESVTTDMAYSPPRVDCAASAPGSMARRTQGSRRRTSITRV